MALLSRIFARGNAATADPEAALEDDVDAAAANGAEAHGTNGNSTYAPRAAHAQLLERVRAEAEADAVRHAEDMLDRQFPIATEAEGIADARIAALQGEFIARDAELSARRATCEREINGVAQRLAAIGAALMAAGVPADQIDTGPLRSRRFANWRIAAGLAIGAAAGYLLAADRFGTVGIACAVAAVLALLAWLFLAPPEEIEEREIAALRENHAAVNEVLIELNSEVARIEIERDALRGETLAAAKTEVAFAGRLAAAYENAAFSAMPAGSLEEGREFAEQREPSVELPGWVLELETVA